jgi:hypothetical protein
MIVAKKVVLIKKKLSVIRYNLYDVFCLQIIGRVWVLWASIIILMLVELT